MATDSTASPPSRVEIGALALLTAFTVLAVVGFGVFALHPERLPADGFSRALYRRSYPMFAQLHIWLSAAALAVVLVRRAGVRWLPAAFAVYALSFFSEHVGTGYGIPFGAYGYSGLLGHKLGGRVPFLIPLSWFFVALPAYALASRALAGRGAPARILAATGLLVAWDLALDPAMSFLTPYWWWGHSGVYYGMPAVNLLGWALTGVVLMGALELLGARRWTAALPASLMAAYYGIVLLLPLGMVAAAGLWGAVAVTTVAVGGMSLLLRHAALRRSAPRPEPGRSPGPVAVGG